MAPPPAWPPPENQTAPAPPPAWPPPENQTAPAPPPAWPPPENQTAPAPLPAWPPPAAIQKAPAQPAPLRRAGLFKKGINIDLIELGALQAFGSGGSAGGIVLALGPEIDLGPRAALRIPLRLGFAGDLESPTSFLELVLAPAYVYRFRHEQRQRWVPFVGGALNLGFFQFGRQLLGLPPSPPGISQTFLKAGAAPEALGGILYSPASFFALRFAASYTYMLVAGTSAHALTETMDVRFMF
jgi:hypothetical protein